MKYCIFLIALLLSYTSNLAQIPQPVGLYPFQENANDYSTKQNHGINVGALPCEDRFGNERAAFYFDGKSSVIIPDAPHLRSEEMTIIFWYQVEHQNPQPI